MPDAETPLEGGLGGATRIGDTVRRKAGEWTASVHALLGHLEAVGFRGAPRALSLDDEGHEILSFVRGSAGPGTGWPTDDECLASAARLVRDYHDAVEGFVPPPNARWQFMVGAPREGPIVCHNDLSPVNTIYANGEARALIDWDFAAPATRNWDLAYAIYRFVPLYDDGFFERHNERPPDRPRRLRAFCDAYGLDDRSDLVGLVRRRVEVLYDSVRTWAQAGIEEYARIWRDTQGRQWLATIEYIDSERERWQGALDG